MTMFCDEIQGNLSAYLDGELPAEEARLVRDHLQECSGCRALVDDLRAVAGLLGAVPHRTAPRDLAEEIQSRLERRMLLSRADEEPEAEQRADRRLPRRRPPVWPRVAAIAACVALAAGIAWLWYLPSPHPSRTTSEISMTPGGPAPESGGVRGKHADELGERLSYDENNRDHRLYVAKQQPDAGYANEAGERGREIAAARPEPATYFRAGKSGLDVARGDDRHLNGLQIDGLGRGGTGLANTLFVVAETDSRAAVREMDALIEEAGMSNVKRRVERQSRVVLADNFARAARFAGAAVNDLEAPEGEETVETVVYEGTATLEQVQLFNDSLASNGKLTAQETSSGAFVAVPRTQYTIRDLADRAGRQVLTQKAMVDKLNGRSGLAQSQGDYAKGIETEKLKEFDFDRERAVAAKDASGRTTDSPPSGPTSATPPEPAAADDLTNVPEPPAAEQPTAPADAPRKPQVAWGATKPGPELAPAEEAPEAQPAATPAVEVPRAGDIAQKKEDAAPAGAAGEGLSPARQAREEKRFDPDSPDALLLRALEERSGQASVDLYAYETHRRVGAKHAEAIQTTRLRAARTAEPDLMHIVIQVATRRAVQEAARAASEAARAERQAAPEAEQRPAAQH